MGPQVRRRAVALLVATVAAAGLGLTPSPVAAAECPELPCVVVSYVQTVDGRTSVVKERVFARADLQALADPSLKDRPYALRKNPASKGGEIDERPIAQGDRIAINTLLTETDAPLAGTATYLETPNASAVPSVLTPAELAAPAADGADSYPFVDGLQPAVYLTGSGKLGYVRPLRDLEEDVNASDYFQVAGGRLDLTVHTTGALISPTVTSSGGTELDIDATTTFTATFPGQGKKTVRSRTWDFGDGSVKGTKREAPSKSFAERGTYPVAVSIRLNDGSYGRSAPVEIKVAKPPKAPSSGTGGGDGSGGSGGTGSFGGGGIPDPFDPFEGDVDQPDPIEEPPVEEEPQEPVPVDDGLVDVEGYVLAGAEIVPGGTPETIPGTQLSTPTPATQASMRQRIATWVVAALAIAALLGIGAASETRWFRHRLRHLRRRA